MRAKTMRAIQLLLGHSRLSPETRLDAVQSLDDVALCITGASAEKKAK
jgi:hypothetical protein